MAKIDSNSYLRPLALCAAFIGCSKPPSLSQIEQQVFAPRCQFGPCHQGSSPAGGLSLVAPSFEKLVNTRSFQAPSRIRVIPSDPDNSYLMEKLVSPKPTVGVRMPPGFDPLSEEELVAIRDWILGGAQNN